MKSFFNETLKFSPQKFLGLLKCIPLPKVYRLENVVVEIQLKLLNERALGTGENCLCVIFLVNYSNGTSQNRMWELSMNIFTLWSHECMV